MTWFSAWDVGYRDSLRELDKFFGTFDTVTRGKMNVGLSYQVVDKDDTATIYIAAVGYTRDDLNITFQDGVLSVKAELPDEHRPTDLIASKLDYEFDLGSSYKIEEASHENGILAIRMAKLSKDTSEAAKIPVLSRAR
jgi:HSP20 family molecular chaperone IbpA